MVVLLCLASASSNRFIRASSEAGPGECCFVGRLAASASSGGADTASVSFAKAVVLLLLEAAVQLGRLPKFSVFCRFAFGPSQPSDEESVLKLKLVPT